MVTGPCKIICDISTYFEIRNEMKILLVWTTANHHFYYIKYCLYKSQNKNQQTAALKMLKLLLTIILTSCNWIRFTTYIRDVTRTCLFCLTGENQNYLSV